MPLKFVINRPASECDPNAIHIGPTAVDFSMLPETKTSKTTKARIPPSEEENLKRWRAQSRDYLHGHARPAYVNPRHPDRSF